MVQSEAARILYVEDDPGLARLVQKRLERVGYVVDIASDGEEGIKKYEADSYDLMFVDQNLPVYDGLEVIRILASRNMLPPTVMITGSGDEKTAVESIKLGASDYIVKDTGTGYLELLPTVVTKLLQQRRAAEEKQRTEQSLRESQQELQSLMDASPTAISWADLQGNIQYINHKHHELFGYTLEDIPTIAEWQRQADQDPAQREQFAHWGEELMEAHKQGISLPPREMTVTCKDGSIRYVTIEGTIVSNHNLVIFNDITERKQMEEALRENEERFRRLIETTNVGVSAIDEKGVITYANNRFGEIWGYSVDEIMGRHVSDFLDDENRKILKENLTKRKKGESESYEITWTKKDGSKVSTILSPTPVFDADGRYKGSYGFITDITERKQMEEDLRKSEERFRKLVETMKVGLTSIDQKGVLTYANEQFCTILGYSADEVIGRPTVDFYYDDETRKSQKELFEKRKKGVRNTTPYEIAWRTKDGKKVYTILSPTPYYNADGRYIGSSAIQTDITERRRMEEDLQESEKRFRLLVEHSSDTFLLHDLDGKIIDANQQACKSLGYTREELLSLSIQDIDINVIHDKHKKEWAQSVPGEPITLEGVHRRKDGTTFPVEIRLGIFESEGQKLLLGLVRDITKRKQMEEELQRSKIEAETANRAKTEFLASMSHEIRTPMNAIIGMADLLLETELNPEQKQYVQVFQSAGENLLNIINDIIDISKVEAGHIQLETIDFDLNDIIEKLCDIMAIRAHKKSLELVYNIMPDVPTDLLGDPTRFRQILVNLIGNAIKFTEKGEVFIQIENKILKKETVELLCSVRDTGIGMSAKQAETIFDPFIQADSSITRKYGGTGLGLAISKQLVELMNGHITVKSKPGYGSTFSFTAQFGIQTEPQEHTQKATVDMKGVKVLVVDDNETNRMIVRNTLSKLGAIVTEADCGESGLAKFKRAIKEGKPYQLALIDRRMPGMDGFELAQHLKESMGNIKNTAVMMLTSDNRGDDFALCKELDIAFYLVKPVKKADLLDAIASIMGRKMGSVAGKVPETKPIDFSKARSFNLLLVEDSADNRLIIQAYFKRASDHIDIAENGAIAVEKFKSGKYDLVLMDVQMPVMDGYTATREIRKWEQEQGREKTPIIALTAHAMKEDIEKSREAGCTDHLTKPIKRATLMEAVQKYTGGKSNT